VRQEATTESNVVTYQVVISAPNANLKLKPGLTANVTIFTKEVKNVLSVPSKALKFTPNEKMLTDGQFIQDVPAPNKVWTLEDGVFKAHKVEVGLTNGITTEITSGLKAGQKVVTEFQIGGGDEPAEGAKNNNPFMPKPRSSQKSDKSAK